MEEVRTIRIVVASPSDVLKERDAVQKIGKDLTQVFEKIVGIRIEVSRWETDAFPGFHKEGPQSLIDTVLKIETCDILVGLFWKKFGTPVSDANSGTEHEFRQALKSWEDTGHPHIMIYFNEEPSHPKTSQEVEQLARVIKFKENFPPEGLWWSYNGYNEFESIFRSQLTSLITMHFVKPQNKIKDAPNTDVSKVSERERAHQNQLLLLLISLQNKLLSKLDMGGRKTSQLQPTVDVPVSDWLTMLNEHLPSRYRVNSGFVVDSSGMRSCQIDLIIYDHQHSPILFTLNGVLCIPAESVYAVFEVSRAVSLQSIKSASEMASSVRSLKRTSISIVHAGGTFQPKLPFRILSGILSAEVALPFAEIQDFIINLPETPEDARLDLGCALYQNSFEVDYLRDGVPEIKMSGSDTALIFFFMRLLARLQKLGTVPALDFDAYSKGL